jgi:hypothetical protein
MQIIQKWIMGNTILCSNFQEDNKNVIKANSSWFDMDIEMTILKTFGHFRYQQRE